jgi:hypothetical protein
VGPLGAVSLDDLLERLFPLPSLLRVEILIEGVVLWFRIHDSYTS